MKRSRFLWPAGLTVALLLALAACGGDDGGSDGSGGGGGDTTASADPDKVTVQLKWVTQAQFAGYYAAQEQGYFEDENLDVTIKPGGPDIVPEQVVLGGQAEFGLNWLDNTLATRDQGGEIINIAQVYTRSGMTEVTWKDTGIDDVKKLAGKKVGVWLGGNEHKLFAALTKNGLDPQKDVKIVAQPFDMNLFLNREVDSAAAMTYNELAQVLEAKNPDTGELYTLDELNVFKMSDLGTGALEDGVFVRSDWIQDEGNQDIAKRFLKATFKGWIYCRDNPSDCVDYVLAEGSVLKKGHQAWQMNEVNALIWPAPLGIGVMDPESWEVTKQIAVDFGIVKNEPSDDETFRTDLAEAAMQELMDEDVDVHGEDWQPEEVEVTEGGE
ncbi:MAG: ABC transporter substrate-binding protein [Actinobacteria bacterium]|nr:ABC transporter substrate-binding protein [Actinomycetota bacterium]